MAANITVTFLGTTSGGGPTETRNCSSLVVEPLGDRSLWMVDCAEGTVRQFAQQPNPGGNSFRLRLSQVNKILITHMHADHTMGLLTVLRNVLGIPKAPSAIEPDAPPPNDSPPRVEIFGPRGVRRMLRSLWHLTHTHSEHAYVVHELLFAGEKPSVPADVLRGEDVDEVDVRRDSECVGRDIWCDEQGFWRGIVDIAATRYRRGALVDAGPIEHRDPCIGYVVRELPQSETTPTSPLPRKIVLLGDTYDPSSIIPLIHADPPSVVDGAFSPHAPSTSSGLPFRIPVSLLVHEATDAYLPPNVDPQERTGRNRNETIVEMKTRERGHSTPAMAGAFAQQIGAERLVLNHIGARFPAPATRAHSDQERFRLACMREIERQAAETWGPTRKLYPQAAWDFLAVTIRPNEPRVVQDLATPSEGSHAVRGQQGALAMEIEMEQDLLPHQHPSHGYSGAEHGRMSNAASYTERSSRGAESMSSRHNQHGKRDRDGSSGHIESSSGGGYTRHDSRRGYEASGSGRREGGYGGQDYKRARGRGGHGGNR
ncbi:beta-lactamase-like protein [Trametes meyenii]|nr:beta-lactamase-like protein [Trametes meyenii]